MNNLLYVSKKDINYDFLDNNNLDPKNKNKNYFPFLTTINNLDTYSQNDSFLLYDKNNFELSSKDSGDNNLAIKKETEINNYIINKTNNNINKNKIQIFNIEKVAKLGRNKKFSSKKGKHNKFIRDNLIRKFKVHLIKNIFKFINSCFLINQNTKTKNNIEVLKKISSYNIKSISKSDNLKWLNSKLKTIFSQTITSKFKNYDANYNEKLIYRIYEKKEEKKVMEILEKTVKEMWHIYIYGSEDKNYIGFKTLKNDIDKMRELGETDEYIRRYINVAIQFESIFKRIIGRKKRRNNN